MLFAFFLFLFVFAPSILPFIITFSLFSLLFSLLFLSPVEVSQNIHLISSIGYAFPFFLLAEVASVFDF